MYKLLVCCVIILWASLASAELFLTCDADPNCQTYNIYADGVMIDTVEGPLWYDLITIPPPGISYTAECCNYIDCSEMSESFLSLSPSKRPEKLRAVKSKSP
jgi:hypothetical protein